MLPSATLYAYRPANSYHVIFLFNNIEFGT